ncbi:MAG: hypothetical protein ABL918_02600 [Chakrabartia sp.]
MATLITDTLSPKPITPDLFEKILSAGATLILVVALTAIVKGRSEWGQLPVSLWGHIATICIALGLTPVMLLRKRGDRLHRQLGWIWVTAMFLTALVSLNVRMINRGGFSLIHILSIWTIIQVPILAWAAKTHRIARHRSSVRAMVLGALLIAGFFTFPFNRMLGHWLFETNAPYVIAG